METVKTTVKHGKIGEEPKFTAMCRSKAHTTMAANMLAKDINASLARADRVSIPAA